jgi:hypothetical protein
MGQTLNINQQDILPVPGLIDIQTMQNGYFTAIIDAAQATPLKAGQWVKFQTTNQGPYPKVIAAAVGDVACGMIAFITKQATFNAGDRVEICFFGGLVVWQQATAVAINAGTQVESGADTLTVQASSGQKIRGYALDYFPASGMGRIIQLGILQSA